MKHIIIGTAGHVDHGKTTLIRALTGRNTDRLKEEQQRGITIDLGFTWFDLPNGNRAGIVDVPGHEKFINNMVAGVTGMDLVLLVIAADEGIMPQTREHMDILSLLGVEKSIVVLNKCDMVDEDWLELVKEDIKEELKGTFLENSPMIDVSSVSGAGIPDLIDEIQKMTEEEVTPREINTIPRLPIDRIFTLSGLGTIITGTLISGVINEGDTLHVYPIDEECRVRSVQVHSTSVAQSFAGQRVALNLTGIKKENLFRGCVLSSEGSMHSTDMIDVKLKILDSSDRKAINWMRVHFFSGTSEVLGRIVLLDSKELNPGEEGYVQIRLEEKVALRKGDRFLIRFYSPLETIGGGVVLEPNSTKARRFNEDVLKALSSKESGSLKDVLLLHVQNNECLTMTAKDLAALAGVSKEEASEAIEELRSDDLVVNFKTSNQTYVCDRWQINALVSEVLNILKDYQNKHPYRPGMRKEELRSISFSKVKPTVFDLFMNYMQEEEKIRILNEFVCEKDFAPVSDEKSEKIRGIIKDKLSGAGFDFLWMSEVDFTGTDRESIDDVMQLMIMEKKLVKVSDDQYTLPEIMDEAEKKIRQRLIENNGHITIAEVRDMFQTTRRSAKPILEYMDSIRVTKKTGGESEREAYR